MDNTITILDDTVTAFHKFEYTAKIKDKSNGHVSDVKISINWEDFPNYQNVAYFSIDDKYKERLRELAKDIFISLENVANGKRP